MTSIKLGSVVALAGLLAASALILPPQPAQAQTLMDFLNRRAEQRQRQFAPPPMIEQQDAASVNRAQSTEPQPVVAGPRYYTYRPDPLVRVDLGQLADPVVTGSVERSSTTASPARDSFAAASLHLPDISLSALEEVGAALIAHYQAAPDFLWIRDGRMTPRARAVLSLFDDADSVGLDPADYRVERPVRTGDGEARQRDALRFELEMSAKVMTYALDATRGRIDPNRISGYHDFERKTLDLPTVLAVAGRSIEPARYLQTMHPNNEPFRALVAELQRLKGLEEGERIVIPEETVLKPGQRSDVVPALLEAVRERASDALKTDHALAFLDEDNQVYTPELVALVKAYQAENSLAADGIVGRATIRSLTGMSRDAKIEKVRLALEQARWISRDLGERHVMINQPAFRVTYTENGTEALSMRAVVGTKANQTYFFQDELETVELNPYWGVPQSIIINEMLPKLRADPSYLDRLGYEVSTASGRVSSSSVNWYAVGTSSGINVRQPPGASNALGELKILFPNSHAIYMHDTPAKELFARDTRAYSHGCVRLEDPRAMAAAVLGTTKDDIGAQIADGRNKALKVEAKIPVYVAYFTAWPKADGTVEYFDDIYERDMYLRRAMDATDGERHAQS